MLLQIPGNITLKDVAGTTGYNNLNNNETERVLDHQDLQTYPVINYNVYNNGQPLTSNSNQFYVGLVNKYASPVRWNAVNDNPNAQPPVYAAYTTPPAPIGARKYETFQVTVNNKIKGTDGSKLWIPDGLNQYTYNAQTIYPNIDIFMFDYEAENYPNQNNYIYINALVGRQEGNTACTQTEISNAPCGNCITRCDGSCFIESRFPGFDNANTDNPLIFNNTDWSGIGTATHYITNSNNTINISNSTSYSFYTNASNPNMKPPDIDPDWGEPITGYLSDPASGNKIWSYYTPGTWGMNNPSPLWSPYNGSMLLNNNSSGSNGGMMHF